ncbi:hypothetical protein M885DRAFT_97055 [Pelagophyceae sp. CCMP2097]|nr:hypothetical protein M885DRAFT_97055 [Pelagophyceae sp. CCMP2097]
MSASENEEEIFSDDADTSVGSITSPGGAAGVGIADASKRTRPLAHAPSDGAAAHDYTRKRGPQCDAFKTRICKFYLRDGQCPYSSSGKCQYAHSEAELRGPRAQMTSTGAPRPAMQTPTFQRGHVYGARRGPPASPPR